MASPFTKTASLYCGVDSFPIPCGGEDGKIPMVHWKKIKKKLSNNTIEEWGKKFPDANIGLITGPSKLTIIDVDEPDESSLEEAINMFGESPVIARTPKGGFHIFFRSSGEKNHQKIYNKKIDIRGIGGFIVVPPSTRPDVGNYKFIDCGIEDFIYLPTIKEGSIQNHRTSSDDKVKEGMRNKTLFDRLRQEALKIESENDLIEKAREINNDFDPPLPDREAVRTARSVYKLKISGRLMVKGNRYVPVMTENELEKLMHKPRAGMLYQFLRLNHEGYREEFTIMAKSMAVNSIPWSEKIIRENIKYLIKLGFIVKTHTGKGTGDPSTYKFTK
ncbi:bifunctional DNA primase/polymerase [Magnetococcales bacterium HHB-1]